MYDAKGKPYVEGKQYHNDDLFPVTVTFVHDRYIAFRDMFNYSISILTKDDIIAPLIPKEN